MKEEKFRWDTVGMGPLTEESVRKHHQPEHRYRVSKRKYPSGTRFSGMMKRGICYVAKGACRYVFNDPVDIRAGEFARLVGGRYDFEVLGNEDLEAILVWELPLELFES